MTARSFAHSLHVKYGRRIENPFEKHEIQVNYFKSLRIQGYVVVDNENFVRVNKTFLEFTQALTIRMTSLGHKSARHPRHGGGSLASRAHMHRSPSTSWKCSGVFLITILVCVGFVLVCVRKELEIGRGRGKRGRGGGSFHIYMQTRVLLP